MDLELRGFKGSLRSLKTWEETWDENCKIASKVREKAKELVDDVDGWGGSRRRICDGDGDGDSQGRDVV